MKTYYMMIGHGLYSLGLFCFANHVYEWMGMHSILTNKGMLTLMPSMSLMWFLLCSSNMSSPPSLNLAEEICIMNSLIHIMSAIRILMLSTSSFLSASYSLYLFSCSQHGSFFQEFSHSIQGKFKNIYIMMHWMPLNLKLLNLNI